MTDLKQQLYQLCAAHLEKQEAGIKKTIAEVREAAGNETKSSAGDKYETGREVMQQEIDLNMVRLNELNKQKAILDRINPDLKSTTAQPGSAVFTNNGNYYIAIGAGQLKAGKDVFYAISAASPIGTKLTGLRAGDSLEWNGKTILIENVL